MSFEDDFIKYSFIILPLGLGVFFFQALESEKILIGGLAITALNIILIKINKRYSNE